MYGTCRAGLWAHSGRQPCYNLHLRRNLHSCSIGVGYCYFQLFRHHAAGNVCNVLFHADNHSIKRIIHAYKQHAALGADNYRRQSAEIFYGSDASRLSQRKQYERIITAIFSSLRLCGCVQRLGGVELQEKQVNEAIRKIGIKYISLWYNLWGTVHFATMIRGEF